MSLTCMYTYSYTDNIDTHKREEKSWFAYRYANGTCISVPMQNIMFVVVEW